MMIALARASSIACLLLFAALSGSAQAAASGGSSLLWVIVHSLCVPGEKLLGIPAPCVSVDLGRGEDEGFAMVARPTSATGVILVPTKRIVGIEDPQLQSPGVPNYWADAWSERTLVEKRLGRPIGRDWIAMAVNSAPRREQDQLHIHIDCLRSDVRQALRLNDPKLGKGWTPIPLKPKGRVYLVKKIGTAELGKADPFQILAAEIPSARSAMANFSLDVVGGTFSDGAAGFYLITHRTEARARDFAGGVDLLDRACKLTP